MRRTLPTLRFLPREYRPLSWAVVTILVLFFLTVFALRPLISRIQQARSQIQDLNRSISILEAKRQTLASLNFDQLGEQVNLGARAIPTDNSAVPALARFREIASEVGAIIANVQVSFSQKGEGGLSEVALRIEVEGPIPSLLSFFEKAESSLPLMKIERGRLSSLGESGRVSAVVTSFWGKLPETLPDVETPVLTLTLEEQDLLLITSQYTAPTFLQEELPAPGVLRPNPFSF